MATSSTSRRTSRVLLGRRATPSSRF
jgi:hypothetical protein